MVWTVPCRGRLTSPYGPRVAPVAGATTWHRGVDLAPPVRGQRAPVDVHSVGPGRVRAVGRDAERGVWVVIAHDDGSATTYQHLATRVVAAGMRVDAGTTLGVMGATGTDAGVHLHLEAFPDATAWVQRGTSWRSSTTQDPELFLAHRGVTLRDAIAVSEPVVAVPAAPVAPPVTPSRPEPLPQLAPEEDDDMHDLIRSCYVRICLFEGSDLEVAAADVMVAELGLNRPGVVEWFWNAPADDRTIAARYQTHLGRQASPKEIADRRGQSNRRVYQDVISSPEARAHRGA